jgi:hypothetical protein
MSQRTLLKPTATACFLLGPSSARTMETQTVRPCLLLSPSPRNRNRVRAWGVWSKLYFYLFG